MISSQQAFGDSAEGLRTDVRCNHENQGRRLSLHSIQIELCSSKTRTAVTKCITKKMENWNVENGTSPILHSLCIRIHDIIHPNDPVDNGKGSGNKRADKVRHQRRPAKSSFGLLGFFLRFPGIWSFLLSIHELNMFSPICSAWNASKKFSPIPVVETLQCLTLYLFVNWKQFFVRSPGKVNINLVSQFRNDGFVRYNVIYFTLKRQDLFWDINSKGFGCCVFCPFDTLKVHFYFLLTL